ncbi:MAG: ABC transporter substrate-binding protein [Candidatus Nezhaarchaeales archaeon]
MAKLGAVKYLIAAVIVVVVIVLGVWYIYFSQPPAPVKEEVGTIKVAVLGPMASVVGQDMLTVAQIYADWVNQEGGIKINGKTYYIEVISKDTNEYVNPADAAKAAEEAITKDRAQFLLGGVLSSAITAIREVAMDYKVMYISSGFVTTSDMIKSFLEKPERYKYWFSIAGEANDTQTAENYISLTKFVVDKVRNKTGLTKVKIAIIYETRPPGEVVPGWIIGNISAMPNVEVVYIARPSPSAADLSAELMQVQEKGAHILFAIFSGPGGTTLGVQLKKFNITVLVIGSPGTVTEVAAVPYQIVVHAASSYALVTEEQFKFFDEFKRRTGRDGPIAAAGLQILVEAIKRAKSINYDDIVKALEGLEIETGFGRIKCNPQTHCFSNPPGYSMIHAEQWFVVEGKVVTRKVVWKSPNSYNVPFIIEDIVIPKSFIDAWTKK